VGTGSGILAVTLAKHLPAARVVATDMSKTALEVAAENAQQHGVAERIEVVECDLLSGIDSSAAFDFIVSNPPYVSAAEYEKLPREVKNYEPCEALLAGPKGTEVIERLLPQAVERLKPGGHLLIEISPMIHNSVQELIAATSGLESCPTVKDLARLARVVVAKRV
jgi:release factor glutamine methyltransferase